MRKYAIELQELWTHNVRNVHNRDPAPPLIALYIPPYFHFYFFVS